MPENFDDRVISGDFDEVMDLLGFSKVEPTEEDLQLGKKFNRMIVRKMKAEGRLSPDFDPAPQDRMMGELVSSLPQDWKEKLRGQIHE